MHPADRLAARVRDSGATPILTFYDLAVPGHDRVELSATSLANAVAKTAGLLRDELDAEPGDLISINLPVHWQLPVWLLACAATGTVAGLQAPPDGARACAAEAEVYAEAESPLRGRAEWDVAEIGRAHV